jgi:class 3 adenylate cyclase
MNRVTRVSIALHSVETLYSLAVLTWFFVPLFIEMEGLFTAPLLPLQLYGGSEEKLALLMLMTFAFSLVPLISLLKITSPFLERRIPALTAPVRSIPIMLNVLSSGLVLFIITFHIMTFAKSESYFQASSPLLYVLIMVSLVYNGYFLYFFVIRLSARDTTFQEYLEFKRSADDRPAGVFQLLLRQGIQKRLIISFVPLILIIIAVLSFVLMESFSRTILNSVIQAGKDLADRTASVIKANPSDTIAMDDYLSIEARKNPTSALQFRTMSYYQREPRTESFIIQGSTDRALIRMKVERRVAPFTETLWSYDPVDKVYEFSSPVSLSTAFLGFVMVDYSRDVIYEPYFRTQVKVFIIAAIFIYVSIFLIYVSGRSIVFPILFLRMSVNSISNMLSNMIKGKVRFSSELLQYKDRVATKDEIKSLSTEIGNMTTVIRGIVPYISASTLKYAERSVPTTEKRELTFLFTDIRGFTTLCEGMKPGNVVEMLNHYLDIQSSVILANGGDVDKFVGDAVMAMFEGQRKETNACKTSMEIRKAMAEEKVLAEKARTHSISIGIGIHTGPVIFGSVGAKDRMDFTSIGDTVNLAARLEGANKIYGTKTLLTEAVHEKVKASYLCREIDRLTVKGKTRPVRIFELLQARKNATEKLLNIKKIFEEGLHLYRGQKWQAAEKAFVFLRDKFDDETSAVFLKRVALYKKDPPGSDWVFNLTVK